MSTLLVGKVFRSLGKRKKKKRGKLIIAFSVNGCAGCFFFVKRLLNHDSKRGLVSDENWNERMKIRRALMSLNREKLD
jgi:hypothetical protein